MLHKRTNAVRIKEGDLCLREQYITAVSGEDTKTFSRCIFNTYSCRFALFEIIAG